MPEYKPQVTLGNWIQIAVMLIGGALAWAALDARAAKNSEGVATVVLRVERHEERLRTQEVASARIEERLVPMATDISWIRGKLTQLEKEIGGSK